MESCINDFTNLDENFTILATTPTGFEKIAIDEIKAKVPVVSHCLSQGKIFFQTSKDCMTTLHSLKSVDNLYVVVKYIPNYTYNEEKEKALDDLRKIPNNLPWSEVVDFWRLNQLHCKKKVRQFHKTPEDAEEDYEQSNRGQVQDIKGTEESEKCDDDDDAETPAKRGQFDDILFRVSATRVGKQQSILSPEAEHAFGGALNDHTLWNFDLSNYNFEVNLVLGVDSVLVSTSLTSSSLHRRHITHFGITTLRGTIAYNMARLCKIKTGDIVLDPMCGSGSISIEAASDWKDAFHIAADNFLPAIERTRNNVNYVNKAANQFPVDVIHWDVTNLPWKANSIDVVVTDMPFGKRMGSTKDNRKLYPAALSELARVVRVKSGRACFLTRDKRSMSAALQSMKQWWKTKDSFYINIGGLKALVYFLKRSEEIYVKPEEVEQ